jgi:hypothetical protein
MNQPASSAAEPRTLATTRGWLDHQSIQHTTRYTQLIAAPFKDFWSEGSFPSWAWSRSESSGAATSPLKVANFNAAVLF